MEDKYILNTVNQKTDPKWKKLWNIFWLTTIEPKGVP